MIVATLRRTSQQPELLLWVLYLLLFPLYVFKSGLPQPGDLLVLLMAPVVLLRWDGRLPGPSAQALRPLLVFTSYVVVSALAWSIATSSWTIDLQRGFLLSPAFYVYNALLFVIAIVLYRRHGDTLLAVTVYTLIASVLMQAALSLVYSRGDIRGQVLFNNPNQLGYFSLLSGTILLLLQRRLRLPTWLVAVTLLGCSYLALLSASKAALGSLAILVAVAVFDRLRTVFLVGGIVALALSVSSPLTVIVERTEHRIRNDQHSGFFLERGYDRILNHPEYWIAGSGEGNYLRFKDTTTVGSVELHSSAGTLFFCYGFAGTGLFLWFLWRIVRGAPIRLQLQLLPAAAYGFVHQGLRFTLLWVLLAIVVVLRAEGSAPAGPGRRGARP
ncbi:MAG: hypothetical protein KBG28_31575 [Kofleriaceae bacterium]|nr:hypothetical protein [Kofleriaceae bacterium]